MRVLVTGGRGQLGSELAAAFRAGDEVLATGRAELDVTDRGSVWRVCAEYKPDVVIHAAAYTNVDGCELDADRAYRENALGTQNVALACQRIGAAMTYVSTDFVFDGTKTSPYLEFDDPHPISVYGRSKMAGERYVQSLLDRHFVVRTSWLYGHGSRNFVKTILTLAEQRSEIPAVVDEVGSPTYARDLAEALVRLIQEPVYGVYHLSNEGSCSRYEYVKAILEMAGKGTRVYPVSSAEFQERFPLPAKRPAYSVLGNFCAKNALGVHLRPWQEALEDFLRSLEYR
ncbi:MAG: dTDP-4-dehydrorhamnose reductase [Chloroflexi bacterium]|nr:dTDP-4-dehydrorhamnose reductase [Chloroflexota bacterium]